MRLTEVFDAIEVAFLETMERAPELTAEPPHFASGEAALHDTDASPRVIFVPRSGRVQKAKGAGPALVTNPRPLYQRDLIVEGHVWGKDLDEAEALCEHLAGAVTGLGLLVVSEDWPIKAEGVTTDGVHCILGLQFNGALQYSRVPDPTTQVTSTEITTEVQA